MHPPDRVSLTDLGPPYDALLDELLVRWGEDTRFVVHYTPDSVELAYLRDDLIAEDLLPRIAEVTERARTRDAMPTEHSRDAYGDLETTVTIREDVVTVHFHGEDNEGLVAVTDRNESVLQRLFGE